MKRTVMYERGENGRERELTRTYISKSRFQYFIAMFVASFLWRVRKIKITVFDTFWTGCFSFNHFLEGIWCLRLDLVRWKAINSTKMINIFKMHPKSVISIYVENISVNRQQSWKCEIVFLLQCLLVKAYTIGYRLEFPKLRSGRKSNLKVC